MSSDKVDVRFTTNYDVVGNVNHVVGVIGSYKYLGSWDPKHALLLEKWGTKGCWSMVVKLPLCRYFEWKLILINKLTRRVQKWEDCANRWNWIDRGPIDIIVGWNSKEMVRCSSCHCLVGKCWCTTIYTKLFPLEDLVDVTFRVIYSVTDSKESTCLSLIGSSAFLGNWNPVFSRIFPGNHNPILTIQLPKNTCFEWKLVVLGSRYRDVIRWEERRNRMFEVQVCPLEVGVAWNQEAKVGHKCNWMDTCWVALPCRCKNRYCKRAHSFRENFQNNRTLRKREKVAEEAHEERDFEESDCAHFSYDPVFDENEMNRDSITSADNIDGSLDQCLGIDGLGLDDIYSCSVETDGQQHQGKALCNTEAKTRVTSKISKPEKETGDQNYVRHEEFFSNKQSVNDGISEEEKHQSNDEYILPTEIFTRENPTNHDNLAAKVELKSNEDIRSLALSEKPLFSKHGSHNKVLQIEKQLSSKLTDDSDMFPLERQLPKTLTNNDEMSFKTEPVFDKPTRNNKFSPLENLSPNKSKIDDDMFSMEKPSILTNDCTTTVVEKQSSSTIKSIIARRDHTYRLKDKHVHFSDNPVSVVFEANEAPKSQVDKTDSMSDLCCFSIHNLWLDETENCRVETAGMQHQKTDNLSSMEKSLPNKPNCSGDVSLMEKSLQNKPTCSGDVSLIEKSSPNKQTNSDEVLLIENLLHIKTTNSSDMLKIEKSHENKPTLSGDVFLFEKAFSSEPTNDNIYPNKPTTEVGLLTIESTQSKQLKVANMVSVLKLSLNEHRYNEGVLVSQKFHPSGKAACVLSSLKKHKSNIPINDDEMAESEEASSYTNRTILDNNGTKTNMLSSIEYTKFYDLELLPTRAHFNQSFYTYPSEVNPDDIKGRITTIKTLGQDRRTIVSCFSPQRTQGKKIELRVHKLRDSKHSFNRFFSNTQAVMPVIYAKSNMSKSQRKTKLVDYRADFCLAVKSEKQTNGRFLLHMTATQPSLTNNGDGDLSLPWTRHNTDKRCGQDIKLPEIPNLVDNTPLPQSNIPAVEISDSLSTHEIMALQNLANSGNLSIINVLQPDLPDSVILCVFAEKIIGYLSRNGFLKTRTKLQNRIESSDCARFTKQRLEAEVKGSKFTGREKHSRYNSLSLSETDLKHKQHGSKFRRPEKILFRRSNMPPLQIMPAKIRGAIGTRAFPVKQPASNLYLVSPNEMRMKERVFFNSLSSDRISGKKLIILDKLSLPEKKQKDHFNNTCIWDLPSLNKQNAVTGGCIPHSFSEQQTSRSFVALTSVVAMMIVGSCIFDRFSRL